jgi:hypothetical protein
MFLRFIKTKVPKQLAIAARSEAVGSTPHFHFFFPRDYFNIIIPLL